MLLTPDEIVALTGRTERAQKRYGSQATELDALGIPYTPRSDKTLIVFKAHVDATTRKTENQAVESPTVCL